MLRYTFHEKVSELRTLECGDLPTASCGFYGSRNTPVRCQFFFPSRLAKRLSRRLLPLFLELVDANEKKILYTISHKIIDFNSQDKGIVVRLAQQP